MLANLFRVVGLVCIVWVLTLGHAAAQSLTPEALSAVLLTQDEVTAVFESSGADDLVTTTGRANVLDHTLFPNAVLAERRFKTPNGQVLSTVIAPSDSPPTDQDLGAFLLRFAHVRFDLVPDTPEDGFVILGPAGIADSDLAATFPANWEGKPIQMYANAFVKNNVYGVLFYGSPDSDGTVTARALAQAQSGKLP